jgi:hypothetical protein
MSPPSVRWFPAALVAGNQVPPVLAGVDDLGGGHDLGEVAAFAAGDGVVARLEQPDRVREQPPQPDDRK